VRKAEVDPRSSAISGKQELRSKKVRSGKRPTLNVQRFNDTGDIEGKVARVSDEGIGK
jgi:hypothetical protein